ncbi:MAG: shikimate dehydrogenase [Hyphomicrobiales bacterium]|nr:shikimate dehydrogenase [Hyphomicrobiales bacterium]MDE2016474.1 shikimate dehydrogenase [Hyphomicrobiales bacterium]
MDRDLAPDGATRLFPIVGDPIAHVRSPAGMSRAFAAAGRNALCVPAHVAAADFEAAMAGFAAQANVDGLLITMPHKFAGFAHCATASARSRFLRAVNLMRREPDGTWHGDMLDGLGFVAAAGARGGEPRGERALLVGAGGAGSAIALALIEAGVSSLAIHDVDAGRRDALVGALAARGGPPVTAGSADPSGFGFVANATSAGMAPGDPLPLDVSRLALGAFVACVETSSDASPLVLAARARGHRASTGADMFVAIRDMMVAFLLGTGAFARRGDDAGA